MKTKLIVIAAAALLALSGCASRDVGNTDASPTPSPTATQTAVPDSSPVPTESVPPAQTPDKTAAPIPKAPSEPTAQPPKVAEQTAVPQETPELRAMPGKADAQEYIGESAGSLTSAVGQPISRDYAPSCIGEGEDGEYRYDGYTVYTYRENGVETVTGVE